MSELLINAVNHYSKDFTLIDVPYMVDVDVSASTKPDFVKDLHHSKEKVYVGSGEQSFIQLMKDKKLLSGKQMCITPCYRDEEILDDLHNLMFMKLELIEYHNKWNDHEIFMNEHLIALSNMISSAKSFFKKQLNYRSTIETVVGGHNQYDILINGIEVGSYGGRETAFGRFIYGTGVAFPRINQALQRTET